MLYGMNDADTLYGHGGTDTLDGGLGLDTFHGGTGADTFKFVRSPTRRSPAVGSPTTCGISPGRRATRSISRAIDANTTMAGDQAFIAIGIEVAFTGVAGELRYNSGILEGDVNGDRAADFQIRVNTCAGRRDRSVPVSRSFRHSKSTADEPVTAITRPCPQFTGWDFGLPKRLDSRAELAKLSLLRCPVGNAHARASRGSGRTAAHGRTGREFLGPMSSRRDWQGPEATWDRAMRYVTQRAGR